MTQNSVCEAKSWEHGLSWCWHSGNLELRLEDCSRELGSWEVRAARLKVDGLESGGKRRERRGGKKLQGNEPGQKTRAEKKVYELESKHTCPRMTT